MFKKKKKDKDKSLKKGDILPAPTKTLEGTDCFLLSHPPLGKIISIY